MEFRQAKLLLFQFKRNGTSDDAISTLSCPKPARKMMVGSINQARKSRAAPTCLHERYHDVPQKRRMKQQPRRCQQYDRRKQPTTRAASQAEVRRQPLRQQRQQLNEKNSVGLP